MALGNGLRLPARSRAQAAVDRLLASPTTRLDPSCYDLLASEARLASLFAIAKGDVPARHWFRLGRTATPLGQRRGADLLVGLDVRVPDAVAGDARAGRQPARADQPAGGASGSRPTARSLGMPWGISESAYNARDLEFTYQYSNFGVPGLGLKRGLVREHGDRALRDRPGGHGRSAGRAAATTPGSPAWARAAATASTRRWISPGRACPKAQASRSCALTWRITRA